MRIRAALPCWNRVTEQRRRFFCPQRRHVGQIHVTEVLGDQRGRDACLDQRFQGQPPCVLVGGQGDVPVQLVNHRRQHLACSAVIAPNTGRLDDAADRPG